MLVVLNRIVQEYSDLCMVNPHSLLAISTFSCLCSLIIYSIMHYGIHKGLTPSSLDHIHFYIFLECQLIGGKKQYLSFSCHFETSLSYLSLVA